jgi:hypothetical protein
MGAFYSNLLVRGTETDQIISWLGEHKQKAILLPARNQLVPVFHLDDMPQETMILARQISQDLSCTVLAVNNHDDDILSYWLHHNGELIDEYTSISPDAYFGMEDPEEEEDLDEESCGPVGGDAALLCQHLGGSPEAVEPILRDGGAMGGRFIFANERHRELLKALGIDGEGLNAGYDFLSDGFLPPGIVESDLIRVG